jgi:hypothetical protein
MQQTQKQTTNMQTIPEKMIFLYDITSSMGSFLPALLPALLQSSVIAKLCGNTDLKIGIGWYCDYDRSEGYVTSFMNPTTDIKKLIKYLSTRINTTPIGGGGIAEAFKTSFTRDVMPVCDDRTLVIHYTDAYPHDDTYPDTEGIKEKKFLSDKEWKWVWIVGKFKTLKSHMITLHSSMLSYNSQVYKDLGEMVDVRPQTSDILQKTIDKVLELFKVDVEKTVDRFRQDQKYQKHCIDIFREHLITHECIDALQTNPLFLAIWRAMCSLGDKNLITHMSDKMGKFSSSRPWLSAMIMESYKDIKGVEKLINDRPEPYPAVCYTGDKMSVRETMDMARTGNSKAFVKFFSECKIINSGPGGIPLSLKPYTFLQVLAHLICPGIMFKSKRSRWILAATMFSTLSDDHPIRDHAFQYLQSVTGHDRVLDISKKNGTFTEPMDVSPHMINLVLGLPPAFTTNEERKFYTNLSQILEITNCSNKIITISVPRKFYGHAIPSDIIKCPTCNENRHPSLMPTPDKCAMCIHDLGSHVGTTTPIMYECKICTKVYQIVRHENLNVCTKCHQCRSVEKPAPFRKCITCYNKFINYNLDYDKKTWMCGCCEQGQNPFENKEVKVLKIISENPCLINIHYNKVFGCNMKYSEKLVVLDGLNWNYKLVSLLNLDKKPIITESLDVIEIIKKSSDMGVCNICCSDVDWKNLSSICGNGECKITACTTCMETYWNRNAPGKIFHSDLCPYCRREPKGTIWKRWNKNHWMNLKMPVETLDLSMYHFWCVQCHFVTPYIARECAGNIPEIVNQMCMTCQEPKFEDCVDRRKKCPSCTVLIEHGGGCNHIECDCGTHFCFVCEHVFDEDNIYDHFNEDECPMYGF